MKSILTKLFLIVFCVSFIPSLATASGFTGFRDINFVYQRQCTSASRGFEVVVKPGHDNPDGCTNPTVLNMSCHIHPVVYANAVQVILAALSTGGQIDAFVNGCDSEGQAQIKAIRARAPVPPAP